MEKLDTTIEDGDVTQAGRCGLNCLTAENPPPLAPNNKPSAPVVLPRSSSLQVHQSPSERAPAPEKFDRTSSESPADLDLDKSPVDAGLDLTAIESMKVELERQAQKINELQQQVNQNACCLNDTAYLLQNSPVYLSLSMSHQDLENRISKLGSVDFENAELRRYIASMREGIGPRHDESHFKTKIAHLEQKVKAWSMEHAPTAHAWKDIMTDRFLRVLEGVTPYGKDTVQFLKKRRRSDVYSLFHDTRTRRHFYAHLISLELYRSVLTVFAFGLDRRETDTLDHIQDVILKQGSQS
jgi:hypothetical protein